MPLSEPLILITCNGCDRQTKRLLHAIQAWKPNGRTNLHRTWLYDDEGIADTLEAIDGWIIDTDEDECFCPSCVDDKLNPLRYEYEYADMMEDEPR